MTAPAMGAPKKLIALSQTPLSPAEYGQRASELAQAGLDGVVLTLEAGRVPFMPSPLAEALLRKDTKALARLPRQRPAHDFVLVNATATLDWFDEAGWQAALGNIRRFARAARIGGCVGLVLDPECYGPNPWTWRTAPRCAEKSFREYQDRVRVCGAEWMRTIEAEFPGPRILTLFMNGCESLSYQRRLDSASIPAAIEDATKGMAYTYSLLPAFMEGVLSAASDGAMIVDGNEPAYYYPLEGTHASYARWFRMEAPLAFTPPGLREKYRRIVRLGSTVYANFPLGLYSPEWSGVDKLTPAERLAWVEYDSYEAFRTTDEYVWEYLDDPLSRWTGTLPPGYDAALRRGRLAAERGRPCAARFPATHNEAFRDWESR